ncbi:MAG: 30S ribosomal protein S19 [Candidatus Hodarchaeales archaeon]
MSLRRQFKYRGRTLEELKKLSMDEFLLLLPSRARRSLSRGMSTNHIKFYEKVKAKGDSKKPIRTHLRDFLILPEMVGRSLNVHNGHEFIRVNVLPEMIGHYLGEFAPTQKTVRHSAPGVGATRSSQFVPLK